MTKQPEVTVVTLTGFPDIFDRFQRSLHACEPEAERIVVTSRNVLLPIPRGKWKFCCGVEPFVFARNANIGIRAAGRSDVLLVNDDVEFCHAKTIQTLSELAYSDPAIGIISPRIIGGVGNHEQSASRIPKPEPPAVECKRPYLAFVCVYIKHAVFDLVGPIDEDFDGYGGEDESYSLSTHKAGFKLAIATNVVVRHGFGIHRLSASFARTMGNTARSMEAMRQRFRQKHGLEQL